MCRKDWSLARRWGKQRKEEAYDDQNGRNNLRNDCGREIFSFDHIVHRLGQDNDPFAEDDQGKETTALVEVSTLEADGSPVARAAEDDQSLE